jgi:hypothetical protein
MAIVDRLAAKGVGLRILALDLDTFITPPSALRASAIYFCASHPIGSLDVSGVDLGASIFVAAVYADDGKDIEPSLATRRDSVMDLNLGGGSTASRPTAGASSLS